MNTNKTIDTTVLAWHFTDGDRLRNGRPVPPIGEPLIHDGPTKMCSSGLHASRRIIDALNWAPGYTLHRVECSNVCQEEDDKLVCKRRVILWSINATEILSAWGRWCALQVIDLWHAPDVVREFLETSDKSLLDAALHSSARTNLLPTYYDAACDYARAASWDAAWNCSSTAACAAWSASWNAALAAAWSNVWDAACDAVRDDVHARQETKLVEMIEAAHAAEEKRDE